MRLMFQLGRVDIQMNAAFLPAACSASGTWTVVRINSIVCKVSPAAHMMHEPSRIPVQVMCPKQQRQQYPGTYMLAY
jgi:hypothetical protein